jgi:hypothetical protein
VKRLLAVTVLALAAAAPARGADAPSYRLSLEPREALFGDAVTAEIDVAGGSSPVRIHTDFRPYRVVAASLTGGPERRVYRWRLECLRRACLPGAPEKAVQFRPVRLTWSGVTVTRFWPPLRLASRIDPRDLSSPELRSNVVDQPPVTYDLAPGRVELVLVVVAALLLVYPALLLARLARRLWRRLRLSRLERMTPMERALELLRVAAAMPECDPRRRALERVARELGEDDVAADARRLAWSRPQPESEEMDTLRSRVKDGR